MHVEFWFDFSCPYAFLASRRIDALAAQYGAKVTWVPILLGGLFRSHRSPDVPASVMSPPRARLNLLDIFRSGERAGVRLQMPADHPRRTVAAMRLILSAPAERQKAVAQDLFSAYWERGEDVRSAEVLGAVAARHGLDVGAIESPAVKQALFDTTAEAFGRGVFGVPTIAVGDRLHWGQDRLHFVEAALGGPAVAPALPVAPTPGGGHIRFFHDFASPYSYLAAQRVEAVAAAAGATLEWVPILLGGLFRAIGTPDVPLLTLSRARQAWVGRDLEDWAAWWNIPFSFPKHFPLRSVLPLRVALASPAATRPLYRAYWAEGQPIDDPACCQAVLDAAGFDGAALLARTAEPAIKQQLIENTAAAQAAGACGVPTFEVTSPGQAPLLVWGQDRLDLVMDAARGLRPEGE